ncbi:hypothetical protein IWZ03DRAFT_355711 [Phyllosticta citriasiana]|uniref:Uncharacterized protein n=1 Tax=Phyllosticta citriasiana TaxID=595635 RepID=A0ABR1KZA2_9PEZI
MSAAEPASFFFNLPHSNIHDSTFTQSSIGLPSLPFSSPITTSVAQLRLCTFEVRLSQALQLLNFTMSSELNLDALVAWFDANKEALKERNSHQRPMSAEDCDCSPPQSRASSPACEAYHKDASELATDYWAPGARDCQDFRSRYGIHLLDPDMLGYLAEMNALRDDVVNAPWFSAYVNNTSSKPLKLGRAWEDPTNTECAIMCVSSDVYAALVDMQLLRKQYMPKSDWFLCDVMRTQFERTHGSLDKTPDCLLVNTQTDIAIAEFDRYNPWCEKPKHDFSSLRHREVNGNWW